jgi:hypothetical protein
LAELLDERITKPLPIYYSRSAVVQDWKCSRARYWGYEHLGRGLSPATTALPLAFGILIHDGVAAIIHGMDIDTIAEAAKAEFRAKLLDGQDSHEAQYFAEEQCALGEGLLRGFHRHVWPQLQAVYDVVHVEQEMTYEHDGLTFLAKPDLLLRNKESGDLVYFEYKTTSSIKEQWMSSWTTAVQLHSTIRAVERSIGESIQRVIVQGMNKGYVSYEKQNSPFCYIYHKAGTPPFNKDIWQYAYKAGFTKYPTWQRPGGVKRVVEEMPENVLSQQFPQTPPIFINQDLVDGFFRQRAKREHAIRHGRELLVKPGIDTATILDEYFPQNFEACSPGWGTGCDFKRLCHGNIKDPLQAGFVVRQSHHQLEADQIEASS